MPGPETPPRYRYVKSGVSDDEDEGHVQRAREENQLKDKAKDKAQSGQSKVLAARKRSGSLGRPLCMSRVLDRQRHGGENVWPGQGREARFVLQAPPLLKLGQLQAPTLDPLNPLVTGYPDTRTFMPGNLGPFAPPMPLFQPVSSFDLRSAGSSRRSLSAGANFYTSRAPLVPPAPGPPMSQGPAPPGPPFQGPGAPQHAWPNGCNFGSAAMSVPTPTRTRRDSNPENEAWRGNMENSKQQNLHFPANCSFTFGEMFRPQMQVRPPADTMQKMQLEQMQQLCQQRQREIQQRNECLFGNKASQEAQATCGQAAQGAYGFPNGFPGNTGCMTERARGRWQLVSDPAAPVTDERGKLPEAPVPPQKAEMNLAHTAYDNPSVSLDRSETEKNKTLRMYTQMLQFL